MTTVRPGGSRRRKRLKRAGVILAVVAALCLAVSIAFSYLLAGDPRSDVTVGRTSHAGEAAPLARQTLRVMTLNIAHGRRDGFHQLLQSTKRIRSNLDDIVVTFEALEPDVIALQEADGPSFWSGGFNHVEYLAEQASFGYFARAESVKGLGLSYGTAVLSRFAMTHARSVTFAPAPPSPSKGFLIVTIDWPVGEDKTTAVDLISVHLDFSRDSVRESQIQDIVETAQPRERPLIVLGDFNCSWRDEESPLKVLAGELDLEAFRPDAPDLATFPSHRRRLDWILISSDLEFESHLTVTNTLSDHYGVIAEIGFAR